MKKIIFLLLITGLPVMLFGAYPAPVSGIFDFGAGPTAIDSLRIILTVDGTLQDSVTATPSIAYYFDTLMLTYSGSYLQIIYKAFLDGDSVLAAESFLIADLRNRVDTSVTLAGWNPITDNDSLIIDQTTLVALKPTTAGRTLDVTVTGEAGIDFDNVAGTLDGAEIGSDAITAAKIAADAIGPSEMATDAIGADELATSAVTEVEAAVYANKDDYKSTGFSTHSAADVWAVGTRSLTELGFDLDSSNFADSTFMIWLFSDVFFDSAQGSASGLSVYDIWNVPWGYGYDAGSMGDSMNNPSYVQGLAAGLTPADIWAYAARTLTDLSGFTLAAGEYTKISDTGYAVFTTGSNEDQFKATGFSTHSAADVYTEFTSGSNEDQFKATGFSTHSAADVWSSIMRTLTDKTGFELADDAITAAKIADDAIDASEIAPDAIGASEIAPDAIGASEIAPDAITSSELAITAAEEIEDAVYANRDDYKSTGFSTHSAADVWAAASRTLTGLGFDLDSSNFADSTFMIWLFSEKFFDSTQGTAAGLTPADIWAYATKEINGGYVDSNKTEQGGSAGGDGAFTRYVVIVDTTSGATSPVASATIRTNNEDQSGIPYSDCTDNNGLATFNLDAGTWVILFNAPGYKDILDTITITGTGTDTILTYTDNANKTVVYGSLIDARGQRMESAVIWFELKAVPSDSTMYIGDSVLTATIVYDTTDAFGKFEIPVYANSNVSGADSTYYRVQAKTSGGRNLLKYRFDCIVNDTSSIALTDLTRW